MTPQHKARPRRIRAIRTVWNRNRCLPWRAAHWLIVYGVGGAKRPRRKDRRNV